MKQSNYKPIPRETIFNELCQMKQSTTSQYKTELSEYSSSLLNNNFLGTVGV
jgi:hypothetical protein